MSSSFSNGHFYQIFSSGPKVELTKFSSRTKSAVVLLCHVYASVCFQWYDDEDSDGDDEDNERMGNGLSSSFSADD